MSKDRARPFSRKHRRYWIPITGGMILIGVLNVAIGFCSYAPPPPEPQRIELTLPAPTPVERAPGSVPLGEVPAAVMQTFAITFPRNVPKDARKLVAPDGTATFELLWGADQRASFREDGTLIPSP